MCSPRTTMRSARTRGSNGPLPRGDYTIEVRDLAGHGGPTYFYNLSALPILPDFRLKCDVDRAMIAPGNRTAWFVIAGAQKRHAAEIKIEVKGLPPGVTAIAAHDPGRHDPGRRSFSPLRRTRRSISPTSRSSEPRMLAGADGKPVAAHARRASARQRSICPAAAAARWRCGHRASPSRRPTTSKSRPTARRSASRPAAPSKSR